MSRRLQSIASAALAATLIVGCGGSKKVANRDPVFPVNGKIVYNGKPVAGADVTFICKEKDRSAFGKTDSDGKFKLTTFSTNDGAVAGKHTVVVLKNEVAEVKPLPPVTSPDYVPPSTEDMARAGKTKPLLPKKYGDLKTSDLIAVVNEDGANVETVLELKD